MSVAFAADHPSIAFRKSSSGSPLDQLMRVFGGSSALATAAIAVKSDLSKELPALALAATVARCAATGTGLAAALGGERRVAATTTGAGAGGRPALELFFFCPPCLALTGKNLDHTACPPAFAAAGDAQVGFILGGMT